MNGWVKLHRKFVDWEWFSDLPTRNVFLVLLLMAEHKTRKWKGMVIHAGQVLTNRAELVKLSGFPDRQVRTALRHLVDTGEIACETPTRSIGTIITINRWIYYQSAESAECEASKEKHWENQLTEPVRETSESETDQRATKESTKERPKESQLTEPVCETSESETDQRSDQYIQEDKEERNNIIYMENEKNDLFQSFWEAYPRKNRREKERCRTIFYGYPIPVQQGIIQALSEFTASENWQKDDGKWIPGITKWLSEEQWKRAGTWITAKPKRSAENNEDKSKCTYDIEEIQRLMILNSEGRGG